MAFGKSRSGTPASNRPQRRDSGMSGGNGGGGNYPQRGGNSGDRGGDRGGRGGSGGGRRTVWGKAASLYSDYSCLELQVAAEWFSSSAALKFAAALDGTDNDGVRNYDHDAPIFVTMSARELVAFRHQIRALLDGSIGSIQIVRDQGKAPHKVLTIENASAYDLGEENLVVSVDEYADGYSAGANASRSIIFLAKPDTVVIGTNEDGSPNEVQFYPDLEVVSAFVESFLGNFARVDFASVRLIEGGQQSSGGGARPATKAMPQRRGPGGGAPAARDGEPSSDDVNDAFNDSEADEEVAGL